MSTLFEQFTTFCQIPTANANDIAEWNTLSWGTNSNTDLTVSVGLFQWDLTCLQSICAQTEQNSLDLFAGCGLINSGEIDGIAIAAHWNVIALKDITAYYYYGVVISGEAQEEADTMLYGVTSVTSL